MKHLILKVIPNSFSKRIAFLILILAFLTMSINVIVTIFYEYSNTYNNARKMIDSQFSIMSKDISEAIITDDIYRLYTMIEEVSSNISHIDNIIIFDSKKGYITDAKVRKTPPERNELFVTIEKELFVGSHKTVGYIDFYISRQSILNSVLKNVAVLILINGLVLIFGAMAGMFISNKLTWPMLSLSEQISKLDVLNLPYKVSLPIYSSKETQQLKNVIEDLSENLKESLDKISQQQKDISRSERLAYIGTMSAGLAHELKNPIMSINLILESLAADYKNDKQFQEDYRIIKAQADKLVYRINEFLNYSKPISLNNKPDMLFDIISEIKRQSYSMKLSGLDIITDAKADIPMNIDRDKFIQIFEILLNNSKDAGADRVSLEFYEAEEKLNVTYEDNGPGFAESEVAKIMLPFYSTKKEGSGLGLAICSAIIDAMGGIITAENLSSGGACFKMSIPLEYQQP